MRDETRLSKRPASAALHWPVLSADESFALALYYEIDAQAAAQVCPPGTEPDLWEGKALLSVSGARFSRARWLGWLTAPLHSSFDVVNLRCFVRRSDNGTAGTAYLRHIVPDPWIAWLARWLRGENMIALRMRHTLEMQRGRLRNEGLVEYSWRYKGRLNRLGGLALGEPQPPEPGSLAAFAAGRECVFTQRGQTTYTLALAHPEWRVWPVTQPYLLCDVQAQYGELLAPFLRRRPLAAFLSEGSPVTIFPGPAFRAPANHPNPE